MGCERSLEFFLSEKIILRPTTYFKPGLDDVCVPTFPRHWKPQRRQRSIKASLTSHVSNWMPSSEATTLSDLLYWEVWQKAGFAALSPEAAFPQVAKAHLSL